MVNRIHVVEEARHVRFAREEVARQMASIGPIGKAVSNVAPAIVPPFTAHSMISPKVHQQVGHDPAEAVRAARSNPNFHATRRWMAEKIMAFLAVQGMVTWYSKPIYRAAHLL